MLKKIISLIIIGIVGAFSAMTCCAQTEYEDIETDVPPKMLFLGDSIASGFGLDGYESGRENCRSYANILTDEYSQELPDECGFSMDNLAIDGQTSSQLLEGLQSGKYDKPIAEADCIVISIGGNDMLGVLLDVLSQSGDNGSFDVQQLTKSFLGMSARLNKNLEAFDGNISGIAKYISQKTAARIIVQTLYNPLESFERIPALQNLAEEKIDSLNQKIIAHSHDESGEYSVCDVAAEFSGKAQQLTRIGSWDIHPNGEGHQVIAETLDKSVRSEKYSYKKAVQVSAQPQEEEKNKTPSAAIAALIVIFAIFAALIARMIISLKNKNK